MRCFACDTLLTDFESTRKIVREDGTIEYPDLCNECFASSGLDDVSSVFVREDLQTEESNMEDTAEMLFWESDE